MQLLESGVTAAQMAMPRRTYPLTLQVENLPLPPNQNTLYWCQAFALQPKQKMHLIKV